MTATKLAEPPTQVSLYERDGYAWSQQQAKLIRDGRFSELDIENIAEELESLGKSFKHQIENRLRVILMHLLKWAYQPGKLTSSWRLTIVEERSRIEALIEDNPSLSELPDQSLEKIYRRARRDAAVETEMPVGTFPEACPFTVAQVLDHDFWPAATSSNNSDR